MVIRFIIGVALTAAALLFAFLIGGGVYGNILYLFLDVGSLLMIILIPFAVLLMSYTPREMGKVFGDVFSKAADKAANYAGGIIFMRALERYLWLSGVIMFITAGIAMLARLEDKSSIGPGVAQSLLVIFYAAVLNLVFTIPCKAILARKQSEIAD